MLKWILIAQGVYFTVTGIWPIVSIRTFQMVTGPKRDLWLVKTVGALIAVAGCAMLVAGFRDSASPEILALAIFSAAALMLVDIIYVAKRIISFVYLVDGVVEFAIILAYMVILSLTRHA